MAKDKKTKRICNVEGCDRPHCGLGFCHLHYMRFRKNGDPGTIKSDLQPRYTYNASAFTNNDEISYYLLGAFMSDGHVIINRRKLKTKNHQSKKISYDKSCGLTSKDRDWLELINQIICPEKPIQKRKRKGRVCYDINYSCSEICDWLISKGCVPRKSLILKFPKVPKQFLPDFLRGMWDGDGSIALYQRYRKDRDSWEKDRSCCLYTSSKRFAKTLEKKLTSIGFSTCIYTRIFGDRPIEDRMITSHKPNYRVYFRNAEITYAFLKLVYYPGCKIVMPRKLKGAQDIITDWEREYRCEECNELLDIGVLGRCRRFCKLCNEVRRKASVNKSAKKRQPAEKPAGLKSIKRAAKQKAT